MDSKTGRIAGAPISWGVCEAPDWGVQLPPETVLADMARIGLPATELGPTGYLGADAPTARGRLDTYGLRLVGGFLPVELHTAARADLTSVVAAAETLAAAGGDVLVLAADLGSGGYDQHAELDDRQWEWLFTNLERVREIAAGNGLAPSLHPHVGTAIETDAAVRRLLHGSNIPLCLDTGHLMVGGTDPVRLTRERPERIGHVHLKDVDATIAARVAEGSLGFTAGVRAGLFPPLGEGDVQVDTIVHTLEGAGYRGWYVLEQDTVLDTADSSDATADAERGLQFVRDLVGR